jgi:hypothetical protein
MRRNSLLLAVAAATVVLLGSPTRAAAACVACGNFGQHCLECQDNGTCAGIADRGECNCRQLTAYDCIAYTQCFYSTSCTIADGGRLDCPLQPGRSIPQRRYTGNTQLGRPAGRVPRLTHPS